VRVLELLGDPSARDLLARLAKSGQTRLAREAAAADKRLQSIR
jgi:hypothetical protein